MKLIYLDKIKSLESPPKIVNIFSAKELKMIQELYATLPERTFNKKQKANFLSKNDIDVYIDPMSEFYLIGTTIDFINEDYNKNIFESKFIFDIDKKLASTCGCGVSFTPKNYETK